MFVVTTLRGDLVEQQEERRIKLSINIGAGLFDRNQCFGANIPEEPILEELGLSCERVSQLSHCGADEYDALDKAERRHCDDFYFMQEMEYLAIFATVMGALVAKLSQHLNRTSRSMALVSAVFITMIALTSALAMLARVQDSDMVDFDAETEQWKCVEIKEMELCHGFGASFYLQSLAIALLTLAFVGNTTLAIVVNCRAMKREDGDVVDQQEQPLLMDDAEQQQQQEAMHGQGGYVISRPLPTIVLVQAPATTTTSQEVA